MDESIQKLLTEKIITQETAKNNMRDISRLHMFKN